MELDGNRGSIRNAGSGLPLSSLLWPVVFGLTCGRTLEELPKHCSYLDDCTWAISIDFLGDKNKFASNVRRLLDQACTVLSKHSMELDDQKTELALIYKVNQK
jgi:hypothetical protein